MRGGASVTLSTSLSLIPFIGTFYSLSPPPAPRSTLSPSGQADWPSRRGECEGGASGSRRSSDSYLLVVLEAKHTCKSVTCRAGTWDTHGYRMDHSDTHFWTQAERGGATRMIYTVPCSPCLSQGERIQTTSLWWRRIHSGGSRYHGRRRDVVDGTDNVNVWGEILNALCHTAGPLNKITSECF